MRTKPVQLSVMAVAALAVFAVAAVMLLASGNPAQADTASLAPDGGGRLAPEQGGGNPTPEPTPEPTPTPSHPTRESCAPTANHVMNSGHLALFEAYWDADTETLVNNPCPPTLRHIPAVPPKDGNPGTPERHVRTATGANIGSTIFHATSDYKGTLVAAGTPTNEAAKQWSLGDYDFLADGGTGAGQPIWVMTECPEGRPPAAGQLCLGFSGGLLHPYYWEGEIEYEFEFADETDDIDPEDRGDVFVFSPHDEVPEGGRKFDWKTTDADRNSLAVSAGDYTHRMWAFTKAGTYRLSVHAKAHPKTTLTSGLARADAAYVTTFTSIPSTYTIHVGLLADLGVEVAAPDAAVNPGEDVTIQVIARNADGSDTATSTKVDVTLPEGLVYKSHVVPTGTSYNTESDTWSIGSMAEGDVRILTVTATVAEGTRGTEQKVKATIYATEHIGSSDVVELDPLTDDNMAMDTVTVRSIPNTEPTLGLMCSVNEFAKPGTAVCDPLKVKEPNASDTLTYGLTGDGAGDFTVQTTAGGKAQIVVAQGANIAYATRPSYTLTLTVSDGKDLHGNADPSVDHSIDVMIQVLDFTVSWSASTTTPAVGGEVTFTITLENPPVPVNELSYRFSLRDADEAGSQFIGYTDTGNPGTLTVRSDEAETLVYRLEYFYLVGDDEKGLTQPELITVTWAN